jgi:hypothetical protein
MNLSKTNIPSNLLTDIRELLTTARGQIAQARAQYGAQVLQWLSAVLTNEFGKGFDVRNLRHMRHFYLTYPIWNAVRTELSEEELAREWAQLHEQREGEV